MSIVPLAHAAETGFAVSTGIPGPLNIGTYGLLGFIQNGYIFALVAAGVLAVASIVYGALQYTASRGNPSKLSDAWDRIVQALIGLLLLVGAGTLLAIINPGLLHLELPGLVAVNQSFSADQFTTVQSGSQNPTATTNPPAAEVPGPNEKGSCKPASIASQFTCAGRWVQNAQTCSGDAPALCIYPTNTQQAQACMKCPGGGSWGGLVNGNTCVCEQVTNPSGQPPVNCKVECAKNGQVPDPRVRPNPSQNTNTCACIYDAT